MFRRVVVATAVALLAAPLPADAQPLFELPPPGEVRFGGAAGSPAPVGMVLELSALAVLGTEPSTTFPEVEGLKGTEPELGLLRVGIVSVAQDWPLAFSLRFDLSEGTRLSRDDIDDEPAASVNRFIDDAYLWLGFEQKRARPLSLVVGRQKVLLSPFRHIEERRLTAPAVPFVVDRIIPDRRWGAAMLGEHRSLSYGVGAYADPDRLEPRADGDPSTGGRVAASAAARFQVFGSHGREHVARAPIEDEDAVVKQAPGLSIGGGVLYRHRAGDDRLDASLSSRVEWSQLSALAELILSADGGDVSLSVAGEASYLFTPRVYTYVRAEDDSPLRTYAVGAGIAYYVTADRLNRFSFFAWLRRERNGGPDQDGVVVQLQASL